MVQRISQSSFCGIYPPCINIKLYYGCTTLWERIFANSPVTSAELKKVKRCILILKPIGVREH